MSQKILLIPSWYPHQDNPLVGSFFQEQAAFLANYANLDIKVLYGTVKEVGWWEFLVFFCTQFLKKKLPISQAYLSQSPPAYSFEVKLYKKWFNPFKPVPLQYYLDKYTYFMLIRAYAYAYRTLHETLDWQPDKIHAQSSIDAGIFAYFLSRDEIKKPYVVIEHQVFLLHHFSIYKQDLIADVFRYAEKVGVVSEHQKKMVLMHVPQCNPIVIWNYVDEQNFYIAPIAKTNFTLITVTYPSFIKDYLTFFATLKELYKVCQDFQFIIIGNSAFNDIKQANTQLFEEAAKQMGVHHLGTFLPFVSREDLPRIMNQADVFIATSVAETFGIAAREAMLCGLPVVTTACGGIEDSITPETGITTPIKNPVALKEAILKIKNKEYHYNAHKIREFVIGQSGQQSFGQKMLAFYQSLS